MNLLMSKIADPALLCNPLYDVRENVGIFCGVGGSNRVGAMSSSTHVIHCKTARPGRFRWGRMNKNDDVKEAGGLLSPCELRRREGLEGVSQ